MEGEHTPTIIHVILSTDHDSIQLKDSLKILRFSTISHNKWRFKKLTHNEIDSVVKNTLEKKLHQDRWIKSWTFIAKSLSNLLQISDLIELTTN